MAATAWRIHFLSVEGRIRFWRGAHGLHLARSHAMRRIRASLVVAAGAGAAIVALIVGPHQLGRFVETAGGLLRRKRGPVDEHPSGGIYDNI